MVMYEQQQQQQQQPQRQPTTAILALDDDADDEACSCGGGSSSNSTIPTTTSTLWGSSSWMNGGSSVSSNNNNNNNTMDRMTEMMVMMSAMDMGHDDYPFGKGHPQCQQHAALKNHGVDSSSWCNNTTNTTKKKQDKDTVVTDSKPPAPLVRPAEDQDVPACAAPSSQKRDALVEQQQHYEHDRDLRHEHTSHQKGRHCHAPPPMLSMTTSRHEPILQSSARPLRTDRLGPGGRDHHGYHDHDQPSYHHDPHYHDHTSSMYPSSSSSRRHDHDYHDMYDQQRNNYTSHSLAQRRRVHPTPRDPHYYYYYDNNEEEEDDHRTCYSEPIRPGVPPRPRPPPSRRVPPNHYHPRDEYNHHHHHHHHHGGPPRQYHSSFSDHDYYESQHDYHRRAVRSVGPPPGSSSRHHCPPLHHEEHFHYAASLPTPPLGPPRGRRPPAQARARVDLYSTHHEGQDHAAAAAAAAPMIEISPGVKEPLRGARETTQAVHDRFLTRELCLGCNTTLYCIADCLCVMCPNCQFMSPVLGTTDEHDDADVHDEHRILQRRGLGLGFTRETLDTILQQPQQEQQQPLERVCHPRAAAAPNVQRSAA